ncbi:MAG: antitoxin Xre-like helix-turn-helix domain-containing protein [Ginsengibacter sp.]
MQKDKKHKGIVPYKINSKLSGVQEPFKLLSNDKNNVTQQDFTYKDFKKIADRVPFTQKEWSDLLHISERTLQRYSKDNSSFNFSVTDRILQINKVIKKGVEVFGSSEKFITWLKNNPFMLEGNVSFQSLGNFEGINRVLTQLSRIEYGILA